MTPAKLQELLEEAARKIGDVEPVTYRFGGQTYDDARATLGACEEALRALAQQATAL